MKRFGIVVWHGRGEGWTRWYETERARDEALIGNRRSWRHAFVGAVDRLVAPRHSKPTRYVPLPRGKRVPGVEAVARAEPGAHKRYMKSRKARIERRRAKTDPECAPAYGRFSGYF